MWVLFADSLTWSHGLRSQCLEAMYKRSKRSSDHTIFLLLFVRRRRCLRYLVLNHTWTKSTGSLNLTAAVSPFALLSIDALFSSWLHFITHFPNVNKLNRVSSRCVGLFPSIRLSFYERRMRFSSQEQFDCFVTNVTISTMIVKKKSNTKIDENCCYLNSYWMHTHTPTRAHVSTNAIQLNAENKSVLSIARHKLQRNVGERKRHKTNEIDAYCSAKSLDAYHSNSKRYNNKPEKNGKKRMELWFFVLPPPTSNWRRKRLPKLFDFCSNWSISRSEWWC